MNLRIVLNLISFLILLEGFAIALSAGVSFWMKDPLSDVLTLLSCGAATILSGGLGALFTRSGEAPQRTGSREGFAAVVLGWVLISLYGALPFICVCGLHWYDALFETISGFTTTGATVIDSSLKLMDGSVLPNGIESLPYGILFWRAVTHWIGGLGIVVFFLAILPFLGSGSQALYNAEVPGVKMRSDQFTPRIAGTAKILCMVYVCLTALQSLLLYFGGMTLFDAVCHSFATLSTGGFSTKNSSIAFYRSGYIQLVIMIFMFLGSCNFLLHFRALTGLPLKECFNEEFRVYSLILLFTTLVIGFYLFFSKLTDPYSGNVLGGSFLHSFRAAAFQVISLSSTTGFTTADYTVWPPLCGVLLTGLMFLGGCGGSTSGGIKCMRVILLSKFSFSELQRNIFPRIVRNIRVNNLRADTSVINRVLGFFTIYMLTLFLFQILLTAVCNMDLLTAFSASATCIGNVGPGFGRLSPVNSCSWISPGGKLLMALEMLIGRLELYSVMIFFLPGFWKK